MKWKISTLMDRSLPVADDVDEAAALWHERLLDAGDDPRMREAFEAWRAASPDHAAASRRVQSAAALARTHAQSPALRALREETLARVAAGRQRCARTAYRFSIAASLLAAVVLGAWWLDPGTTQHVAQVARDTITDNVYRTGIGQRSTVTLDDGSLITLNTDSRVSVHYADAVRAVTLERGQALFKVAKDPTRPFVVSAGDRQVTALGTEFEVHLSDRALEVTLLEGRVAVARTVAGVAPPPVTQLWPGQQYVAIARAPPQVRAADVKRVVSWRHGQIVFQDERLDDAIAEMNRYSRRKVVLDDAHLGGLKISGAFNTGDTGTFVEALTQYFPIEREPRGVNAIVLKPRPTTRG